MQYLTLGQVRTKVLREHDLLEETFITPDEIDSYIREAIDLAETVIIGLYEDYFLTCTDWLPIPESKTIDLPTDIYANKLRKVSVRTGQNPDSEGMQLYKNNQLKSYKTGYNIYHKLNQTPQLVFERLNTSITEYQLKYNRNANRPILSNDIIDLPEVSIYFVSQYCKVRCYQKERDPQSVDAKNELNAFRITMENTLSNIVDDGTEILQADMSFYEDFDNSCSYLR